MVQEEGAKRPAPEVEENDGTIKMEEDGAGVAQADKAAPDSAAAEAQAPSGRVQNTYLNRELKHLERERSGEVRVHYIANDGAPLSGRLLIGLKNVFSKCLPNMPKEYITRLIFDRRHRSVIIARADHTIIAGITYRPFHAQRFAEIAFCAVAQNLQVSGFGTRLMAWTKRHARDRDDCQFFVTYADNNAVGYFSKQGFSKTISMDRERWHGYIKDYDGGTLMECAIHPTLPFTDTPAMILHQKAAIEGEIRKYTKGHVEYPGLDLWKDGEFASIDVVDIPGVREAGYTELPPEEAPHRLVLDGRRLAPTQENLERYLHNLLKRLQSEPDSWPFLAPVSKEEVPDYYEVIKEPIDLSLIQRRLESHKFYKTIDIFVADVLRMFENAKTYNSVDTVFHKIATKLMGEFQQWVETTVEWNG